jgi:hypothetical protein
MPSQQTERDWLVTPIQGRKKTCRVTFALPRLTSKSVPVEVLVCGRNDLRATDDNIVRFADSIGANARVAFHHSLDDALLKDYIGTLSPLLTRLDVPQTKRYRILW